MSDEAQLLNPGGTTPPQAVQAKRAAAAIDSRRGLEAIGAATVLGGLGSALLREVPWGINVFLWVLALIVAVATLSARTRTRLHHAGWAWLGIALLAAAAVAWRDSSALLLLNVLAVLVALALAAAGFRARRLGSVGIVELAGRLGAAALHALAGAAVLFLRDVDWNRTTLYGRAGRSLAVLRGTLLAAPLLLVFGILFASADPVFARLVEGLFDWRPEAVVPPLFWGVFWGWLAAGYLRQTLWREPLRLPISALPSRPLTLGGVEIVVVLSLLNVLFFAFVLVQFRYLFGGAVLVEQTLALSYAEYARRGFFELVAVAALLLPVLLGLHALLPRQDAEYERRFRLLAALLTSLLFVVLASAAERMRLYVAEYGLTELRFYTSAFMAWLAVVLVWFAATVLRGRRERFAAGAVVAGFALVALLDVVNPDARIAEVNLERHRQQAAQQVDASYLAGLSSDATPTLLRALSSLPRVTACGVAPRLVGMDEASGIPPGDWRSWNWSRSRAERLRRAAGREPSTVRCGEGSAYRHPPGR